MRAVNEVLDRNIVSAELLALKRRERELSNLCARLGDPAGCYLDDFVVEWQNKILAERLLLRERIARLRAPLEDSALRSEALAVAVGCGVAEVRHGHR
jgi:hypothetical protein